MWGSYLYNGIHKVLYAWKTEIGYPYDIFYTFEMDKLTLYVKDGNLLVKDKSIWVKYKDILIKHYYVTEMSIKEIDMMKV